MRKLLVLVTFLSALAAFSGCKDDETKADPAALSVDPAEVAFEAEGGQTIIGVTTNQEAWKADSDQTWCTVTEIDKGRFSVNAAANESSEPMPEATVTVTAGVGSNQATATVRVNQQGAAPEPDAFAIELTNLTASSVDMKVTPVQPDAVYCFDVLAQSVLDEHHESDLAVYMQNMMAEAVQTFGSLEAALEAIGEKGEQTHSFTGLKAETAYIAFAAGIDAEGHVNTRIKSDSFTTEELPSGVTFEVAFTNTAYDGSDYTITPSDPDFMYYATVRPQFQYDELSDADLLDKIIMEDGFMLDYMAKSGVYEYENEHVCLANTGYMVLIFGYSGGVPTSKIMRYPYRTSPSVMAPADCTFDVNFEGITSRSATVSIEPSDVSAPYMYDLIADTDYQQYKSKMKEYVTAYVAEDLPNLDYNRETGESGNMYSKALEPSTTYYIWASCIDEFGQPAADVFVSQPFTTLPNQVSDATVTATIGKYFNGDDLFTRDPEKYAAGKGLAYVPVEFAANDKAKIWYGTMVKEDPSDPTSAISDEEIANVLTTSGTWCPTGKLYWCEWDALYTVLGVAMGSDDNVGPVLRLSQTFTKEGAADISEFVEPTAAPARIGRMPLVRRTAAVKAYKAPTEDRAHRK